MNKRFISKKIFDFVDNIFEVDEDIAETISILNKKGYYTKACCSGHIKDPRIYELYKNVKKLNKSDKKIGCIINQDKNNYDVLIPYTSTSIYIMFNKKYDFSTLPKGFYKKENNIIEKVIEYYDKDNKVDCNIINNMIKECNEDLCNWAKSLPDINKNNNVSRETLK